jgi:plastocyanin
MRSAVLTAGLAAVVASWSCGGGSSAAPAATTTAPSATPSASSSLTVSIVGSDGSRAYNPNPAAVNSGDTVVFRNNDSTIHRIVMDDGSADLGNINPGGSSQMQLKGSGGTFHCTIHPTMVGSINGTVPTSSYDPSCPTGYCLGGGN